MKYLLDVNALVALGLMEHSFHPRVSAWIRGLVPSNDGQLLTCPITELGFVRVLSQAPQYGFTVAQAKSLLRMLKKSDILKAAFIADDHSADRLPVWAKTGRQTTDGHLAELALAHGALLATLDSRIPGGVFDTVLNLRRGYLTEPARSASRPSRKSLPERSAG